jgi:hypothetical protein
MNGVEILNQTNVYQTEGYGWLFWAILGAGFLVGLIFAIREWSDIGFNKDVPIFIFGFTLIGFVLGVLIFMFTIHYTDELDYIKYQVTISDEVSLNDFMDKYEILDQDGKIYTVKEKSND